MTTHDSKACCETQAATSGEYTPRGSYQFIGGKKCYVVGPKSAKKAVFFIYDIFGFAAPTIQGADTLAMNGKESYLVIMPDLFDGKPAMPEWFARDTEEKKQKISDFLAGISDPGPHIEHIYKVLEEAKATFNSAEKWAAIGYCWGGKLVSLTSGLDTPWTVAIQSSPARVDPEDAKKITIPFATLASKDESADVVKSFHNALKTPNILHIFESQIHGWMSARASLGDSAVRKEYERGYSIALEWIGRYI